MIFARLVADVAVGLYQDRVLVSETHETVKEELRTLAQTEHAEAIGLALYVGQNELRRDEGFCLVNEHALALLAHDARLLRVGVELVHECLFILARDHGDVLRHASLDLLVCKHAVQTLLEGALVERELERHPHALVVGVGRLLESVEQRMQAGPVFCAELCAL